MKKLFIKVLLLLFISTSIILPQDKVVKKIIELGKKDNQVMKWMDIVTNRFGGRVIGSDAYDNTADWAAYMFKKWGMQVEFDESGELPVGFNRGHWSGRMLFPQSMELHFATPSYTAGTKGLQRGHVLIEPKDTNEFKRIKGKLKGAWILCTAATEGFPVDHPRAKEKVNFLDDMKKEGILGTIQSSKLPIRVLYGKVDSWDNLPEYPDIKLDENQYNLIKKYIEERKPVELEFDIRNYFKMGPVKYNNVIGIIPGTEFPDEYVLVGGHLDAFDVATGAVDNASGFTPAMEAARLIMAAGGKPKRTILITLWAGEEFGLLGSTSWVKKFANKLDKVSNMFNRDGGTGVAVSLYASEAMMKDLKPIVQPLINLNPDFPFELVKRDPQKRPKVPGGTDSQVFAVAGVPTIGFGTKDIKGYDVRYGETWHTELDIYNKVIPEYLEHTAIVTAVTVYGVANLPHLLSREGYFLPDEPETQKVEEKK